MINSIFSLCALWEMNQDAQLKLMVGGTPAMVPRRGWCLTNCNIETFKFDIKIC
jgi:hypothetical protein